MPTLTPAFAAFADAARRYAAFAAAGDGERAGVALALNELADISEGDWDALASAALSARQLDRWNTPRPP